MDLMKNLGLDISETGSAVSTLDALKDEPDQSVAAAVFRSLESAPLDNIAIIDCQSERRWSASRLLNEVKSLASRLLTDSGLKKGDVVAFYCPNSDHHAIALLAVSSLGAIYTGSGDHFPFREFFNVVNKSGASYIISSKNNLQVSSQVASKLGSIKKIYCLDPLNPQEMKEFPQVDPLFDGTQELSELGSNLINDSFPVSVDRDKDLFSIPFSSGTTGDPKAVAKLHRAMLCLKNLASPEFGFAAKTYDFHPVFSCHSPFSHVGGMAMLIQALMTGCTACILNGFLVDNYLGLVYKFKINCAFFVPSYITQLVRFVTNAPPSVTSSLLKSRADGDEDSTAATAIGLVDVLVAGEPLDEGIAREFISKFNVRRFRQSYGSTEAGWATMTPVRSSLPTGDGFTIKSSGIPLHGTTIRIVDPDSGLPAQAFNEIGEIYILGPQVTPGYLRNESANKSSFTAIESKDGKEKLFFRSGDAGYIDPKGHLFVSDRFKEVIKFDGVQVSPSELESILREHPIVKEVAVVGIPSDAHGQVPKGFVVLNFPLHSISTFTGTDIRTTKKDGNETFEKKDERDEKDNDDNIVSMKPDDDDGFDRSLQFGTRSGSIPLEKKYSHYSSLSSQQLEKELIEFIAKQVAPFKQMRGGIEFLDSFPRTVIGKIDRKFLRSKTK